MGALDLGGSSMEVTFAAEAVPWKEDAGGCRRMIAQRRAGRLAHAVLCSVVQAAAAAMSALAVPI